MIYISTDLHLYSEDMDIRHPFRSARMLGQLSQNFADDITEDDLFIFLGDLCDPKAADIDNMERIVRSIPCKKYMCRGNHDTEDASYYLDLGFDAISDIIRYHNIVFSHKPLRVAPDEVNIHGHLHTAKMSGLSPNHINAYAANWDKDDRAIPLDDLIDAATVQKLDIVQKDMKHIQEKFEKYTSYENDHYKDLLDITNYEGEDGGVEGYSLENVESGLNEASSLDPTKAIIAFNALLNSYQYGYNDGKKVRDLSPSDMDMMYHTCDTRAFDRARGGVCWDYVMYEAWWFKRNYPNLKTKAYYVMANSEPNYPTRTFLTIEYGHLHLLFESSYKRIKGVYVAPTDAHFINFIIDKIKEDNTIGKNDEWFICTYDPSDPRLIGMTCAEYMNFMAENGTEVNHKINSIYSVTPFTGLMESSQDTILDEVLFGHDSQDDDVDPKYWMSDDNAYKKKLQKSQEDRENTCVATDESVLIESAKPDASWMPEFNIDLAEITFGEACRLFNPYPYRYPVYKINGESVYGSDVAVDDNEEDLDAPEAFKWDSVNFNSYRTCSLKNYGDCDKTHFIYDVTFRIQTAINSHMTGYRSAAASGEIASSYGLAFKFNVSGTPLFTCNVVEADGGYYLLDPIHGLLTDEDRPLINAIMYFKTLDDLCSVMMRRLYVDDTLSTIRLKIRSNQISVYRYDPADTKFTGISKDEFVKRVSKCESVKCRAVWGTFRDKPTYISYRYFSEIGEFGRLVISNTFGNITNESTILAELTETMPTAIVLLDETTQSSIQEGLEESVVMGSVKEYPDQPYYFTCTENRDHQMLDAGQPVYDNIFSASFNWAYDSRMGGGKPNGDGGYWVHVVEGKGHRMIGSPEFFGAKWTQDQLELNAIGKVHVYKKNGRKIMDWISKFDNDGNTIPCNTDGTLNEASDYNEDPTLTKYGLRDVGNSHEVEREEEEIRRRKEKKRQMKELERKRDKAAKEKKRQLEHRNKLRRKALKRARKAKALKRKQNQSQRQLPGVKNEDFALLDPILNVESDYTPTPVLEMVDKIQFFDRIDETTVKVEKVEPVYVCLMNTGTTMSKVVGTFLPNDDFLHSAISFDASMTKCFTFSSKDPIPERPRWKKGGFTIDNLQGDFFRNRDCEYAIFMIPCTSTQVEQMKKRLDYFIKNDVKFTYSAAGLVANYFHIPFNPRFEFFCSQFVADILNAGKGNKFEDPSAVRPNDFSKLPQAVEIVRGNTRDGIDPKSIQQATRRLLNQKKIQKLANECVLDIPFQNPYEDAVLNYQLSNMDEAAMEDFLVYLKSFKIRFDNQGNILITRREYDQLDRHFRESLRLIKIAEENGNIEGVKQELFKIYYMSTLIDQYYLKPNTKNMVDKAKEVRKDMMDLRSVMLNAFKQHLSWVVTREPDWVFSRAYQSSKYGNELKVPQKVLAMAGKAIITSLI